MTSTNNSKFCKSCGDLRQIEDNKCTVCDAEYSDGVGTIVNLTQYPNFQNIVVARMRNTLERKNVLQGRQSTTGYLGLNRPVSVDESFSRKKQNRENKQYDIPDLGQATDDNSLYLNIELAEHEDGYMEGRLGEDEGLFPVSSVKTCEIVKQDKRLRITRRTLDASTKTNTLDFEVGTIVTFINKSSDWYWVEYDEKKGWIPVDSTENLSDMAQEEFVEALVDCDKSKKTFNKGDIITVTDRKTDGYRDIIEGRIGTMEVTLPATHVQPYDNNPERSLLVIATHQCNYDGILKVEFGKRVKLKNKYSDYYWVEFKGKEEWIEVDCVVFAPRNEEIKENVTEPSPPTNPGKKSSKDWTQGAGPPLPPKPGKQSKDLSFKKVNTSHEEDKEEDIRIILLGKLDQARALQQIQSRENSICNGRQIVLIDTPGLFDTNLSHETIQSEIIRCVHLSLPGPHLFLIILQITRLTKEETEAVEKLFEIFGTDMGKYALIVFTRSDELEREGKCIESFIAKTGSPLTDFIRKCQDHYIAINNTATGQNKTEMVTVLVNLITDIVNNNNGGYLTNSLIDKAKEAQSAGNQEEKQHRVDTPCVNQDEVEDDNSDVDEIDTGSVKSCDSGISSLNQSIYDEIYGGYTAKEFELNKGMQESESEINSIESEKQKLEKQKDRDMKKIELQLEENKRQVKEITENLDLLNTQFSKLKQQKEGVNNSFKVDIGNCDTKLKNLRTKQTKFLKQKKNLEQKKKKVQTKTFKRD
ncbi:unnamed protein product [Mytilus edulis]|uniref:AIG1-type G domain-containing protein n=1 Tax=Mytilus edulis TaxID=6550 RepID=A0A8S3QNS0_MYTED|nr:unnamed protein product [Mytilus edulis]